jgi:hypothetical protein
LIDGLLVVFALFGMTIEPHFLRLGIVDTLDVNAVAGGGFNRDRRFGFELAGAFAANDQIMIPLFA